MDYNTTTTRFAETKCDGPAATKMLLVRSFATSEASRIITTDESIKNNSMQQLYTWEWEPVLQFTNIVQNVNQKMLVGTVSYTLESPPGGNYHGHNELPSHVMGNICLMLSLQPSALGFG